MSNPYDPKDPLFYMVCRHKLMSTNITYGNFNRRSTYFDPSCPNIPGFAECKIAWDEGKLQLAGIENTRDVMEHRSAMLLGACMDKFFEELAMNQLADANLNPQLH